MSINRIKPGPRMSKAVAHGDTIYLSGHVPEDYSADAEGQTRDILSQIDDLLGELGSAKSKLLSATVYLRDIRDFKAMNAAWDAWVDQDHPPARTTVEARLAAPDIRVEITVIAAQ